MPHVNVKYFPRNLSDEQKEHLAEAITMIIVEHFDGTLAGSVSIALDPVAEADWNETVGVPEIAARRHLLIKTPNY